MSSDIRAAACVLRTACATVVDALIHSVVCVDDHRLRGEGRMSDEQKTGSDRTPPAPREREAPSRVDVIDQAEPGQAGIWRTIARMHQLRTPKTMPGPEQGNVALGFRAWFETVNGPEAFDALDRIPRLAWADYLAWFQQATETKVR